MRCSPRGRLLRRAALVFGAGLLLAVVPIPALAFRTQAAGAVEAVTATSPMSAADRTAAQQATGLVLEGDRVVAGADDLRPFSAIGFTFDAQPSAPVVVRVRDVSGRWSGWTKLESEDAEGPDHGSSEAARSGTEPLWVRDATGYEVSFPADARGAEVVTVRDELTRVTTDATPFAGASVEPPFGIGLRSSWGARPPKDTSYGTTVKLAVVHHSDSSNSYSQSDVPGILRSIQAYHMDGRGWSDIAYNFVVDKFGGLWEGRAGGIDLPVVGAHAQGFNTNTMGVMVIGDYTQATPSAAALESVSKVIGWKMALFGNDPGAPVTFTSGGSPKYAAGTVVNLPGVVGHQDVGLTDCPGSIEGSLSWIRTRSQEWTNWVRATSAPVGAIDRVVANPGGITVIGWAVDLDAAGPVTVRILVDGVARSAVADQDRPDVAARYPSAGPGHGYWVDVGGLSPGWHDVCVVAVNRGYGSDASLGCGGAAVPDPTGRSPVGDLDSITAGPGRIDVAGWATDADSATLPVNLLVNGEWRRTVRTGAGNRFSAALLGIRSGYASVCGVGVNQGPGQDLKFDCVAVTVPGASPRGSVDTLGASNGAIVTSGWAVDDETLDPIVVVLIVDGRWYPVWAYRSRPNWMGEYPGYGDVHGFVAAVAAPKGTHRACVAALNVGGGNDNVMRCADVVVK